MDNHQNNAISINIKKKRKKKKQSSRAHFELVVSTWFADLSLL